MYCYNFDDTIIGDRVLVNDKWVKIPKELNRNTTEKEKEKEKEPSEATKGDASSEATEPKVPEARGETRGVPPRSAVSPDVPPK